MVRLMVAVLLCCLMPASAGELGLLVNGRAVHLERRPGNSNENNYGLGLQYDQLWRDDWLWFLFSSGFQNSQNEPAYDAGGGVRHRYMLGKWVHLDLGIAGMLIDHDGYHAGGPAPAVLPIASVGTRRLAVNMAYIPPVTARVVPLIFFQLMYSLNPTVTSASVPPERTPPP